MTTAEQELQWAKLAAQIVSTCFSTFVGTRHLLQLYATHVQNKKNKALKHHNETPTNGHFTPMTSARNGNPDDDDIDDEIDEGTTPETGGNKDPNMMVRTTDISTASNSNDPPHRRPTGASARQTNHGHPLLANPMTQTSTSLPEDRHNKASPSTRILRVACFSDFAFSTTGAVVTGWKLADTSVSSQFQFVFWAQAPHWCFQVASFCWMATLGLYIAKRKQRAGFDVTIAHAIIWLLFVLYWILEVYATYYKGLYYVNAAKIIWKFSASTCFIVVALSWVIFLKRWRRQQTRRKGAIVVSTLLTYTIVYFLCVGPIVIVDLAEGLNSGGNLYNACSVVLAMWPTANALIYITKPKLCLRYFQSEAQQQFSRNLTSRGGDPMMPRYRNELKGLEVGEKIGEGIAVVYLGKWRGAQVAVKMRSLMIDSSEDLEEVQHACNVEIHEEAEVMRGLCHPNIVLFMEAGFYKGSICIISEYCARGSLRDVLKRQNVKALSWPTKLRLALGISHGIQYLHNANPPMIHRDLKSPNVLVDDSWHAKIADFGTLRFAEIVSSAQNSKGKTHYSNSIEMTGLVGTTRWMAPEVMRGEKIYTSKVDIYSLALILWELIEGQLPFETTRWNHEVEDFVLKGVRPPIKSELCPLRWKMLIVTCWHADPAERPTIQHVISSLQRIAREETWDTMGPRYTGVSQQFSSSELSVSQFSMTTSSLSSSALLTSSMDSPAMLGAKRQRKSHWHHDALDEHELEDQLSESDSDNNYSYTVDYLGGVSTVHDDDPTSIIIEDNTRSSTRNKSTSSSRLKKKSDSSSSRGRTFLLNDDDGGRDSNDLSHFAMIESSPGGRSFTVTI